MTSPNPDPLTINGIPAAQWIRERRGRLVERVLTGLAAANPEPQDADLRWIVGYNLDLFVRALEGPADRPVTEDDAADLVASAARRASEGQPVESLMRDYQLGFNAVWHTVIEEAGEHDAAALLRLTARTHAHLLAVTTLVLRGFHHEAARLSIGERDARYAVYAALLSGDDPATAASRAGLALAEHYLVLSLHLADPPPEADHGPVARHRRANTVQRILAEQADGDVLALIGHPVATALVPLRDPAAVRPLTGLDRLVTALDVDLHVGAAVADVAGVPAAAAQSAEIAELAAATRRPPGAYRLEDVLVEYQLTRPGPGRDLLLKRLAPLDDHPEWEETLRAYLRNDCDRRRTAAELHLHPNSVDYRLSRLAETCGFDAADPTQRALAHASLCVRDLDVHRRGERA